MEQRGSTGRILGAWANIVVGLLLTLLAFGGLLFLPSFSSLPPSSLTVTASSFRWMEQGRELTLELRNTGERLIQLSRVRIDGQESLTWEAQTLTLNPKEQTELHLRHAFLAGAVHRIEIEADPGEPMLFEYTPPAIPKTLNVIRLGGQITGDQQLEVDLALDVAGYESVTWLLEPLASYNSPPLPIYLFDMESLSESARQYADAFLRWAERLDPPLKVQRVDWEGLGQLGRTRTPAILIVFMPWQGYEGVIDEALPAVLLDPEERGRQDLGSLQAWLRAGLVLVTPTTTHPLRAVFRRDGRVEFTSTTDPGTMLTGRLNTWWSVTAHHTRDSPAAQALLWGRYQGEYGGVGELTLEKLYGYSEAVNQFDEGPEGIRGREIHLYNPFFVKSGRGGWLAFADDLPTPETLGHDLALLLTHAPWQVQPLAAFNPGRTETVQPKGGAMTLERRITLTIPREDASSEPPLLLRLLVFAENAESQRLEYREWRVSLER